jgi:hypothetical protein
VTATAAITAPEYPGGSMDLLLTGTFYNDEYLQMMYRSSNRSRRQLGVAVIQLDPLGQTMKIHYAGFSPTRSTFVAGRLVLGRQK